MGLSELPEWAKKGGDDPLEAEIRKQLETITTAIADTSDKKFSVTPADGRLLVSMQRPESNEALFTVSPVDNGEYLMMDADATPRDLPIFVGPRDEMLERLRNEILYTYLENWERQPVLDAADPEKQAARQAEIDELETSFAEGLTPEDRAAVEQLLKSLDDGRPNPPGLN